MQGQVKLQRAILYGKAVMADFSNAPDIREVDLSHYNGNPGDQIGITISDDFKVRSVYIEIHHPDGSLVEKGNATGEAGKWVYTATAVHKFLAGDKITITAADVPDNLSIHNKILS